MQKTLQIRLNSDREKDRIILEALENIEGMPQADAAREWLYMAITGYYEDEREEVVITDNSEVLEAIANLSRKVETLVRSGVITTKQPLDVKTYKSYNAVTKEITEEQIEYREIDLEQDATFIAALKKSARPAMRLEQ